MSYSLQVLNKFFGKNVLGIRIVQNTLNYSKATTENKAGCERGEDKPKKKTKTPKGRLDENFDDAPPVYAEKEPLKSYPNNTNPKTGEIGGPKGISFQ